ncbi:helix-hairpin-helix domain-containing protein [Aureispira]|nr:helix-hairpin-helix domain-containing protein [Aureispira sp.]
MNKLKDFLYYTKSERNAVLILLFIIIALFIFPFLKSFFSVDQVVDFTEWEQDVIAFEKALTQISTENRFYRSYEYHNSRQKAASESRNLDPFIFDPNNVTITELKKMGLPQNTIRSIINYRSKGGQFRTKETLKKIYTLSEEHFQQLLPFIEIEKKTKWHNNLKKGEAIGKPLPIPFDFDPNTASAETFEELGLAPNTIRSIVNYRSKGGQFRIKEDFKKIYTLPDSIYKHIYSHIHIVELPEFKYKNSYKKKSCYNIDINTASSDDFQQFTGIGPSYANRILKLKDALGGFVSIDQISELYKLPDSTFQLMRPYLFCDSPLIRKININIATVEELKAHPYLRWFHAKAIVKYRETEGYWKSVELLQILTEFDDAKGTYERIRPYLKVN